MDIFSLITTDHQEVAGLFKKLHDARGSRAMCEQFFAQLKEALELHAYAEEQVFYPALQEADMTQEMAEEALEDHQLVTELLEELTDTPKEGEAWDETLQILEENVQEHVEVEESDIFDAARQLFSAADIDELAERWQTAKQEQMARHAK
jgi:hemerythrin superfamily protein